MTDSIALAILDTGPVVDRHGEDRAATEAAAPGSGAPERALMAAVLADAVRLLVDARRRPRTVRRGQQLDVWSWVRSDDVAWPYSFQNICDTLGLDAGRVRRQLVAEVAS